MALRLPHILILAAGRSARMRGVDKLLQEVDGQPLLRRVAIAAIASNAPVTVVLCTGQEERRKVLEGLALAVVETTNAWKGMAESLKAGLSSLARGAPALVLLADLPEIGTDELATMIRAHLVNPDCILRGATQAGRPGHPVLIPPWLRSEIDTLEGDTGASQVIARYQDRTMLVTLPGNAAITDLDTPEEWASWQSTRG